MIDITEEKDIIISKGNDIPIEIELIGDDEDVESLQLTVTDFSGRKVIEKTIAYEPQSEVQIQLTKSETNIAVGCYKFDINAIYKNGNVYTLEFPRVFRVVEVCSNG